MMRKKILTVTAAVMIAALALTGCGDNKSEGNAAPTEEASQETDAAEEESSDEENQELKESEEDRVYMVS